MRSANDETLIAGWYYLNSKTSRLSQGIEIGMDLT
jgi:hypothetical protein